MFIFGAVPISAASTLNKESVVMFEETALSIESTDLHTTAPHFSTMLENLAIEEIEDRIEIGTLVRAMEHRSVGALVLILALPMVIPIPAPGISVPFGIFLMLVSTELMFARGQVWLPQRFASRSIHRNDLVRFASRAVPVLRSVEQFARPRMAGFTGAWGIRIVGVTCLILATIIALPIPMGHFLPGIVICVLAIGLIESDGLLIAIGFVAAAFVLGIVTWASALFVSFMRDFLNGHAFN